MSVMSDEAIRKLHKMRDAWFIKGKESYDLYNSCEKEASCIHNEEEKIRLRKEAYRNKHASEICQDVCADLDQIIDELLCQ